MDRRLELQAMLEDLLGSTNVYFQTPAGLLMEYPAITYKRNNANSEFADNAPYAVTMRYLVTLIAEEPDTETWGKLVLLPRCLHERWFPANDLNHDVFNLYF